MNMQSKKRWCRLFLVLFLVLGAVSGLEAAIAGAVPASAVSVAPGEVELQWLPGEGKNLKYEIHLSKRKDFQPSAKTLKLTSSKTEAKIGGLAAGTKYWLRIVTLFSGGTRLISQPLPVRTSSQAPKNNPKVKVLSVGPRTLMQSPQGGVVSRQKIEKNTLLLSPDPMKKPPLLVTGVQKEANGRYRLQTRPVGLGEIYDDLDFSATFRLSDPPASAARPTLKTLAGGQTLLQSGYDWKNGEMQIYRNLPAHSASPGAKASATIGKKISKKGDYYRVELPSDTYVVPVGMDFSQVIDQKNFGKKYSYSELIDNDGDKEKCEARGGTFHKDTVGFTCSDIPVKVCGVDYEVTPPEGLGDDNKPIVHKAAEIHDQKGDYSLQWSPEKKNVDFDHGNPYVMNFTYNIGVGDCQGDNFGLVEKIDVDNIKFYANKPLPKSLTLYDDNLTWKNESGTMEANNTLTITTTPTISLEGKFKNSKRDWGRATLKAELNVKDLAEFLYHQKSEGYAGPFPLFAARYVRVVVAGVVPIVFDIHFRGMAVLEEESEAEVHAEAALDDKIMVELGVEYVNGEWRPVKEGDMTYHLRAGAEGKAKGTLTLRIIPDASIKVESLVAAHMLAEPYAFTTIGVAGKISAGIFDGKPYADKDAYFTDLEGGGGMDIRLYAGAAWKTSIKWFKWPETATFADIDNVTFMRNLWKRREYFETTRTYAHFSPIDKTVIAKLPDLGLDVDLNARPPYQLGSRAVKVAGSYENYESPLYKKFGWGARYPIAFAAWDGLKVIEKNAKVVAGEQEGEYWVIPELNAKGRQNDCTVRIGAHTDLGPWSRMTKELELTVNNWGQPFPAYWAFKYGGWKFLGRYSDDDEDGLTNIEEFRHSTFPDRYDSDGDKMSDGCEVHAGLNPLDPSDADGDLDGDGYSNLKECLKGTKPDDPESHPDPEHNEAPHANAGPDRLITRGKTIRLDGSRSTDDHKIVSYVWTAHGKVLCRKARCLVAPKRTTRYTLIVRDKQGLSDRDTVLIKVYDDKNLKPVAEAGDDRTIKPKQSTVLDGSASEDPDGYLVAYSWEDEQGRILCAGRSKRAGKAVQWKRCEVSPEATTTYTLTVVDNRGAKGRDSVTVEVQKPRRRHLLHFRGENFPDGTVVDPKAQRSIPKVWKLRLIAPAKAALHLERDRRYPCTLLEKKGGKTVKRVSVKRKQNFAFAVEYRTPGRNGTYECSYNVFDSEGNQYSIDGGERLSISVDVLDKPLEVVAGLARSAILIDETANLNVQILSGNPGYSLHVEWGDGSGENRGTIDGDETNFPFDHQYGSEGNYTISLTVKDDHDKTFKSRFPISVTKKPQQKTKWSGWLDQALAKGNRLSRKRIAVERRVVDGVQLGLYTIPYSPKGDNVYYTGFRLAVPPGLLSTDKKMRVTYVTQAGEIPAYDRELWLATDAYKYGAVIVNRRYAPEGTGVFIAKDLRNGTEERTPSAALTDLAVGGTTSVYTMELADGAVSVYAGTARKKIYSYDAGDLGSSLGEFHLDFRGGGKVALVKFEYDRDGNGTYDDGYMILNTPSTVVDWKRFFDGDGDNNDSNGSVDLRKGLVAYYQFEGNAVDSSGKGNDGSENGGVSYVDGGVDGKAVKFGGYDNPGWIGVPNSESLSFLDRFTFTYWFKIEGVYGMDDHGNRSATAPQTIIAKSGDISGINIRISQYGNREGYFRYWANNGYCCDSKDAEIDAFNDENQSTIQMKEWHFGVLKADGQNIYIYLDGQLKNIKSLADFPINPAMMNERLVLGFNGLNHGDTWPYPFTGELDKILIYNRPLNDAEINVLYKNGKIPSPKSTLKLKKTGQTKSYDQEGNEVTDGSVKDDGYYRMGVAPSYSRDDAKEIVTDHVTGLMWQDDADAANVIKNWDDAKAYCEALTLGGYGDWRLPTIEELETIVDYGRYDPAIDSVFAHVTSDYYWSSTTNANYMCYGWVVHFNYGLSRNSTKDNGLHVRCVRGRK